MPATIASVRRTLSSWLAAIALTVGVGGVAAARSDKTFAYPREAVWPTAVRFLVVDEKLKITERDAEAGYAIFELREEGKTFRGSLEVMSVTVEGRTVTRFVIQIADRPSWMELAMLQRLEAKLRAEHGAPAPAPSKRPSGDGEPGKDRPHDAPKDKPTDGKPLAPPVTDGGPPVSDKP